MSNTGQFSTYYVTFSQLLLKQAQVLVMYAANNIQNRLMTDLCECSSEHEVRSVWTDYPQVNLTDLTYNFF